MSRNKKEKEAEQDLIDNPINEFCCLACKNAETMPFDQFKKHLIQIHGLADGQMKGNRQMTMHLDGDTWFSSSYQWTLESGLQFTQFVQMARAEDDPMRHG